METINKRIYLLRKLNNLSQKDFAERIGLKRNSISELEKDGKTITDRNINAICQIYKVDKKWLLTGDGEMLSSELTLDTYAQEHKITEREKELFKKLMELDDDMQKCFFDFLELTSAAKKCVDKYTEKPEKELKLTGFNGSKTIKISAHKIKKAAEKDSCNSENNDNSLF